MSKIKETILKLVAIFYRAFNPFIPERLLKLILTFNVVSIQNNKQLLSLIPYSLSKYAKQL